MTDYINVNCEDLNTYNQWHAVGRATDIAETGDYLTLNIGKEPLVITRDEEGEIRALSRVCRHRGFDLLEGENNPDGDLRGRCGNVRRLRCPYHAWTYKLNGELMGAPFSHKICDFDKSNIALPSFQVEIIDDVIFVSLEVNASPLAPQLAQSRIDPNTLLRQ